MQRYTVIYRASASLVRHFLDLPIAVLLAPGHNHSSREQLAAPLRQACPS